MLRIRRVADSHAAANRTAVEEVQAIIRAQFPAMSPAVAEKLPDQLEDPFRFGFVATLFVAENVRGHVRGFALVLFDPALKLGWLDLISAAPQRTGGGLGAALYERAREEAVARGARGLFFECLPDDPAHCPDAKQRRQNAARLQFYERWGARPVEGTAYDSPINPGDTGMPYLMFDGLGRHDLPPAADLRRIVRAILERKYADICPPEYVRRVVGSIRPDGVGLRAPRYLPAESVPPPMPAALTIPLVVNARHDIHHIRERGYVESPVRIASILGEIEKTGLFVRTEAKSYADRHIRAVHDGSLVDYVERACAEAPRDKSIYPYVFPLRNPQRRPSERSVLAGYWCIDTFTPLNRNAYPAARGAVDCALTAADAVLDGAPAAYALVRPPGHHAERRAFGGFCYFNNAAVAAHYLSRYGRVAVLDIDYHHGNGTQDIFYERADILTVSVHGHPSFAYPYFNGFRDERGRGAGAGYNLNIPLAEATTPEEHRRAVATALRRIARHRPAYLVLAVGFDTAGGDPTGTWSNRAADFRTLGTMIGGAGIPIVAVQEGGYRVRTLGANARNFFAGLAEALAQAAQARPVPVALLSRARPPAAAVAAAPSWREAVSEADIEAVRRLVAGTGNFSTAEVDIAAELAAERVAKGRASGYEFILAEEGDRLLGYACYGPTPGTDAGFDLYWIVVDPAAQRHGLGRQLLARAEAAVAAAGGTRVYVDTSSTPAYAPARAFYRRHGFRKVAELKDFYRPGDNKLVLEKALKPGPAAQGAPR